VAAVAIVGNLARDVIEGAPPRAGGGAFHCTRALRLLERSDSRVVTRCATETLVPALVALGLPVVRLPASATAAFSIAYDGDRRVMSMDGLGDVWSPEDAAALSGGGWVHVAPLARSDFPTETVAALARGRRLSLDGQGLVRRPHIGPLELDADYDPELLRHVTALKLSEEEAEVVGDVDVPELLLTLGSRGSIVRIGGTETHVPCTPLDVDPTGAGDAYMAAYVAARAAGQPPVAAAYRATSVVAKVLSGC
jgi:sugar/nucleoside kinase (ribokinase family)